MTEERQRPPNDDKQRGGLDVSVMTFECLTSADDVVPETVWSHILLEEATQNPGKSISAYLDNSAGEAGNIHP